MRRPKVDQELTLQTDFGETKAILRQISNDPVHPDGALLK